MKTNVILQGDALTMLKTIPDESINCVMTSPPYWALRDYGDSVNSIWDGDENCEHEWIINKIKDPMDRGGKGQHDIGGMVGKMGKTIWKRPSREAFAKRDIEGICPVCNKEFDAKPGQKFCSIECLNTLSNKERQNTRPISNFCSKCGAWKGQLGLEPTFDLYIKHLCDIFDEVKRVLRKDGTCWVNIGDTYGQNYRGGKEDTEDSYAKRKGNRYWKNEWGKEKIITGLQDKSLCLIPFRFAIEIQNRGWILRNVIIWHKPNCMPSSVKDRFTVDFEYVFFFVKNKKYWFETQYEPLSNITIKDIKGRKNMACLTGEHGSKHFDNKDSVFDKQKTKRLRTEFVDLEKGRNKRAVWSICPKPFKEAHFAVYPEELCETPIKAGCPEFVCKKCGKPREKIYDIKQNNPNFNQINGRDTEFISKGGVRLTDNGITPHFKPPTIKEVGYTDCGCNFGFSGGIVLDPFFGSGTTGLVSLKQNKKFIGIELNKKYVGIAKRRLKSYLEQTKLS